MKIDMLEQQFTLEWIDKFGKSPTVADALHWMRGQMIQRTESFLRYTFSEFETGMQNNPKDIQCNDYWTIDELIKGFKTFSKVNLNEIESKR